MATEIPRNFKLLDELENCSKYFTISYGLKNPEDIDLKEFTGMVIDSKNNMSTFEFVCSKDYPKKPPTVKLVKPATEKVLAMFNDDRTMKNTYDVIKNWNSKNSLADILTFIQKQ